MPEGGGGGTHRSWPGGQGGKPRALVAGEGLGGCRGWMAVPKRGKTPKARPGPQGRSKFRNLRRIFDAHKKKKNDVF